MTHWADSILTRGIFPWMYRNLLYNFHISCWIYFWVSDNQISHLSSSRYITRHSVHRGLRGRVLDSLGVSSLLHLILPWIDRLIVAWYCILWSSKACPHHLGVRGRGSLIGGLFQCSNPISRHNDRVYLILFASLLCSGERRYCMDIVCYRACRSPSLVLSYWDHRDRYEWYGWVLILDLLGVGSCMCRDMLQQSDGVICWDVYVLPLWVPLGVPSVRLLLGSHIPLRALSTSPERTVLLILLCHSPYWSENSWYRGLRGCGWTWVLFLLSWAYREHRRAYRHVDLDPCEYIEWWVPLYVLVLLWWEYPIPSEHWYRSQDRRGLAWSAHQEICSLARAHSVFIPYSGIHTLWWEGRWDDRWTRQKISSYSVLSLLSWWILWSHVLLIVW